MTPELTTKLNLVKAALMQHIEEAKKHPPMEVIYGSSVHFVCYGKPDQKATHDNMRFLAEARKCSPWYAELCIEALDALRVIATSSDEEMARNEAEDAIKEMLSTFPDSP